ncbi:hypothetical protein Cs308_0852 [Candidatus Chlamydia sanziniae]|uniref:Uncharacterized protein n=2 Tax=Candidatus Chlamydia sanziniae TaxID=1806891 RepID=A0A1A9HY58_9CHLA|nr:hypothetical protein Cs308_0852 [Candidatus Chlamydia sanziniae]
MGINVNAPAFGIRSSSQFVTNVQGAVPLLGMVIGLQRIEQARASYPSNKIEGCIPLKSSSSPYSMQHCVRGLIEMAGLGTLIVIVEIILKGIDLLLQIIGRFLLASMITVIFIAQTLFEATTRIISYAVQVFLQLIIKTPVIFMDTMNLNY